MEFHVGCSGWSYTSWVGPFYPRGTPQTKWLQHYSRVFGFVEIDSTFYSIPSPVRTRKWAAATPATFRFTAKLPKFVTHDKALYNADRELELFYSAMSPLKEKLLCLLVQLPPSVSFKGGFSALKNFFKAADPRYRYAVEVRHRSWFDDQFYDFLKDQKVALVWNQLDTISAPPVVTADFAYLRLIGDRSIQERDFGRLQKDRVQEMEEWATEFRKLVGLDGGIIAANNHYAGFGPGTAALFLKMLGRPIPAFGNRESASLSDFGINP